MDEPINKFRINSSLCPYVFKFDVVGSTNLLARKFLNCERPGFIILANTQTAGLGQYGRRWESPRNGLWFTSVFQPTISHEYLGIFPILTSLAVENALRSLGLDLFLKWPNDILINKTFKKIGGILVESSLRQSTINHILLGIGINANNRIDQFSSALRDGISSILEELKREIDLIELLIDIMYKIEFYLELLQVKGVDPILNHWRKSNNLLGKQVSAHIADQEIIGEAFDITKHGELVLKTSNSEKVKISTGAISIISF